MSKLWPVLTLTVAFFLLASLKQHEISLISPYLRPSKVFIPQSFRDSAKVVEKDKIEALGIWESLLFGKSKHIKKETSEVYRKLGLLHLFTPSGFHLSAILFPLFWVLRSKKKKIITLLALAISFSFLPGLGALKRMLMIKIQQNFWGQKIGFILGSVIDILFGSFQSSPLSFSYSFLFLSFIYGGRKGVGLVIWFFLGQLLISYFQGGTVSPLLILLSPIMNFAFTLLLPILLICSFPLVPLQLDAGIFLTSIVHKLISSFYEIVVIFPSIEITGMVLLGLAFFMTKFFKTSLIILILLSANLNSDYERSPQWSSNEFSSKGKITKRIYSKDNVVIYFEEGSCRLKLVRGFWWENCSLRKGSSGKI